MNQAVIKCPGCGAPKDRTSTNCPYCGRLYPFENDDAVVLYADDRAIAHVYSAGVITMNDARRMMGYDELGGNGPAMQITQEISNMGKKRIKPREVRT